MHFSSPKSPVPWKVKSPGFLMASFRNCLEFELEERDIVFSGIFCTPFFPRSTRLLDVLLLHFSRLLAGGESRKAAAVCVNHVGSS